MNRTDLQNLPGFHAPSLIAAAALLRENLVRKAVPSEPTAIIRNEGWLNGCLDMIDRLVELAAPQAPTAPKRDFQPYSQPSENPNRP